jgi:hypothetical protein
MKMLASMCVGGSKKLSTMPANLFRESLSLSCTMHHWRPLDHHPCADGVNVASNQHYKQARDFNATEEAQDLGRMAEAPQKSHALQR